LIVNVTYFSSTQISSFHLMFFWWAEAGERGRVYEWIFIHKKVWKF